MRQFIRRLTQRRWFWWASLSLLVPLALLTLAWVYVDEAGNARWDAFRARMQRERETLDIQGLLTPPIPEHENFCAIPPLLYIGQEDDSPEGRQGHANRERIHKLFDLKNEPQKVPPVSSGATTGAPLDLQPWADWMRETGAWPIPSTPGEPARDVLAAFAERERFLAELTPALMRPRAEWVPSLSTRKLPVPLLEAKFPHLTLALRMHQGLNLRAAAAAQSGDAPKAFASVVMMSRLADATLDYPFTINLLVFTANHLLMHSAIWELANAGVGAIGDWERIEKECARRNFGEIALRCYRGELIAGVDATLYCEANRRADWTITCMSNLFRGIPSFTPVTGWERALLVGGLSVLPPGAFTGSVAEGSQMELDYLIGPLRDGGLPKLISQQIPLHRAIDAARTAPLRYPWRWNMQSLSILAGIPPKLLWAQTQLDQATIACVLERFRFQHGSYPETLEGLTLSDGRPLPLDLPSAKPMRYRRTDHGRYALYSVGSDGVDDGGTRGDPNLPAKPQDPNYRGDWVWDFPAQKSPSLPAARTTE